MSTDLSLHAYKPPDEKWKKMKAIYDACEQGGVSVPKEVLGFFNYEKPSDLGVDIDLRKLKTGCISEFCEEYGYGFDINIELLPADIKIIRVMVC